MIEIKLNGRNIVDLVNSLSFENSIDSLSTTVSLTVPQVEKTDFNVKVKVGDKIEIIKEKSIFKGLIVQTSQTNRECSVKAMDIGFYLNKNKVLKQVRNTAGNQAIKSICSNLGIPITIKGLNTKINKLYKTETVADVINDIIKQDTQQTKKEYCIYVLNDKVHIDFKGGLESKLSFKLTELDNLKENDLIISKTITNSIEELKNAILVVSNDSNSVIKLAISQNGKSISKYGKLQEVIELEAKEVKKSKNVAENLLKLHDTIKEDVSIEIVTDNYIFSGQSLKIDGKKYLIKSLNLNYSKDRFNGTLELKEMV